MSVYNNLKKELKESPRIWLITGVAGFIGSHLAENLLLLNQKVVGVDNFSTGYRHNLEAVRVSVPGSSWKNFTFFEGDICDFEFCQKVVQNKDYVLHNAALDNVIGSFSHPIEYNKVNIDGFLNVLEACKLSKVKRLVYASSGVVYGDGKSSNKAEYEIGPFVSPLALSKYVNELYAEIYARCYNFQTVGLRYFNVFGPRQDPILNHDALIPLWFDAFYHRKDVYINGGGGIKRDFCYVDNVVQANILAALSTSPYTYSVYNVGSGKATSLIELFSMVKDAAVHNGGVELGKIEPKYRSFKQGETTFSLADIHRIQRVLGYEVETDIHQGLEKTAKWFSNYVAWTE